MRIIEKHNASGANIYVTVHVDEDTTASVYCLEGQEKSVLNIGTVTIFASDSDLTLLASAIGDHVLKRNLGRI